MEPVTAYDHLKIAGEEACNAIRDTHHLIGADKYNRLLDALHVVADVYLEYENKLDAVYPEKEAVNEPA